MPQRNWPPREEHTGSCYPDEDEPCGRCAAKDAMAAVYLVLQDLVHARVDATDEELGAAVRRIRIAERLCETLTDLGDAFDLEPDEIIGHATGGDGDVQH